MRSYLVFLIVYLVSALLGCAHANEPNSAIPPSPSPTPGPTPPPTPAPTPAPTPSPTPAPKPCPSVTPKVATYNLTKANSSDICIMVTFAATVVSPNKTFCEFALENATVVKEKSKCSSDSDQVLYLSFGENSMTWVFKKDKDSKFVDTIAAELKLNGQVYTVENHLHQFEIKQNQSYFCKSKTNVNLNTTSGETFELSLTNLQLDAFRHGNSTQYNSAYQCQADQEVADFVPLAVGIALLALLGVVFVAYMIFRKQSERSTYQSV